jgi:hypothetical protein
MSAAFADLLTIRDEIADRAKTAKELKQRIQQCMDDADRVLFETGDVSWRRSKGSFALDVDAFQTDRPDLIQRYSLVKSGGRRFLINT